MKTPAQIAAESRYVIHYRRPEHEEWRILRHVTGKSFTDAHTLYQEYARGTLSDCYSNMYDLVNGGKVASSAPAYVYDQYRGEA